MTAQAPDANEILTWGDWIARRARFVGFRSYKVLAAEVGCTQERITAWTTARTPPRQMRKDFDANLCLALQTERKTLFTDYVAVSPEDAPIVDPSKPATDESPLRAEIATAAGKLSGPALHALSAAAHALMTATAA